MLVFVAALVLIALGVWLFCLLDVISTDEEHVRYLPKFGWFLVVLLTFDIGAITWLVLGRPRQVHQPAHDVSWPDDLIQETDPGRPPRGPDDDPDFLDGLNRRLRDDE